MEATVRRSGEGMRRGQAVLRGHGIWMTSAHQFPLDDIHLFLPYMMMQHPLLLSICRFKVIS